ncbi:ADP-ribosylglycohydrolase family protein [Carboxylicivirga linearis]|uniref:ADP-ribosylglycohydrolase family protein n=1 Tax=Carboxylicivirga linearis TaxID=1628157 RepID=A0ABS5JPQ4_9BACT|nr:ADP-ribosylglycohydrolase family protein [Carboxylicivirga linearis]MBS2096869.1 ADP-ribosylglycohydrolase family protein [Carboxylicivirga linearis]
MRGSIIGDIIGSAFIESPQSTTEFQLLKPFSAYTTDTVLTIAIADAIIKKVPFDVSLRQWARKFPKAGYRQKFLDWALTDKPNQQYNSSGDGAARRVAPIGFASQSLDEALELAEKATVITHALEPKVKAAQAMTGAIFISKKGGSKEEIREFLKTKIGYDLPATIDKDEVNELMKKYNSPAPAALLAFIDSSNFEDAIRKAIWLDGPSNTIASITGGLSQAYYKHIPKALLRKTLSRIDPEMESVMENFEDLFCAEVLHSNQDIKFNFH